ncbi:MAG: Smr/MutS family protein [Acidobacteria bacterium]|nr:Smr/MutS family protein [Acidobacteriota bacterium]
MQTKSGLHAARRPGGAAGGRLQVQVQVNSSPVTAAAEPSLLSPASAQALELPSLLAVISRLAATDLGREKILGMRPFSDLAAVGAVGDAVDAAAAKGIAGEAALRAHRRRYEEAARLIGEQPLVPQSEAPVGELLRRLGSGQPPIEGADLVRLAELGRASRAAAQRVRSADPPCPELSAWTAELPDVEPLLRRIDRTLDRRGEVREDASPHLAALRRRLRRVRDQVYRQLGDYVAAHRDELSEDTIPMRGGRLVVVQAAGARGRGGGLVHGRSATGKSFYFEPLAVVETNNALQQTAEDEEAERRRILAELLALARAALPALVAHGSFLGALDQLQAAVRFAVRCGGRLAEIAPRHRLSLRAARHPLLDPCLAELRTEALGQPGHVGAIVPLDVELDPGRRILVITGPNAGGKTVALKTVGLLALAAQCGLPIPAGAGSRVPWLGGLVATVGDDQDLLADRSTFSGRLLRLREAWEAAAPASLVLLDELGSGTDPAEGAALSIALLEGLLERGSLAVITTHLTELAGAALEMDGAACAAMEFDPGSGRPTFRLVPGPPGGSEALALARRLGLPAAWLDRAEARLGSEHRDLRRLLAEVERLRQELAGQRQRLATEADDAEKLRLRLDAERRALEQERREVARRTRSELEAFRRETGERLRQEVGRLEESFAAGRRRGLAAAAVERLFAPAPELGGEPEPEPAGPLAVGQPVRHRGLGWRGVLHKLEDGQAEVLVHGKRLRSRADELAPESAAAGPAAGGPAAGRAAAGQAAAERSAAAGARARPGGSRARAAAPAAGQDLDEAAAVPSEINLIGVRVEPALEQLDSYLDRALLASRREVRVIHGHGTGRLRQAIRQHLRSHAAVKEARTGAPDEGGNGATVVTLRGAG